MENEITWLLFDLTGVITEWVLQGTEVIHVHGQQVKPKELERIYGEAAYDDYMVGKLDHSTFVKNFLKRREINISEEVFVEAYKHTILPMAGIEDLLEQLYGKYKLAIVTNEGVEWATWKLEHSGLALYFDEVIISGDIGEAKPDRAFYETALNIIDAKPGECVFIDDMRENVEAAREMGINSLEFSSAEELAVDLTELGIIKE